MKLGVAAVVIVRARVVVAVRLPDNPTDAQKAAARDKIMKLYKEAQRTKDFAAFAKANALDLYAPLSD